MSSRFHQAKLACVAVTMLVASAAAWSQDGKPEVRTLGAISYVSGGVGHEEVTYMRSISSQYNLQLLFALSDGGAYVSDVDVRIKSESGQELMAVKSDGPMFYAKLPAGTYEVIVTYGGKPQTRKATVADKGAASMKFSWAGPT